MAARTHRTVSFGVITTIHYFVAHPAAMAHGLHVIAVQCDRRPIRAGIGGPVHQGGYGR